MKRTQALLDRAIAGGTLPDGEAMALADCADLQALMETAAAIRDRGHGAACFLFAQGFHSTHQALSR